MKEITLTKGAIAIVDDADYESIAALGGWYFLLNPGRSTGYAAKSQRNPSQTILMHRFIMKAPPAVQVDHWDGDGLNNRRENLRAASGSQNQANKKKHGARSRFKGVWPNGPGWCAMITKNRRSIYLGQHRTEIAAALAYDAAAVQIHGEFARTNAMMFPELMEGQR